MRGRGHPFSKSRRCQWGSPGLFALRKSPGDSRVNCQGYDALCAVEQSRYDLQGQHPHSARLRRHQRSTHTLFPSRPRDALDMPSIATSADHPRRCVTRLQPDPPLRHMGKQVSWAAIAVFRTAPAARGEAPAEGQLRHHPLAVACVVHEPEPWHFFVVLTSFQMSMSSLSDPQVVGPLLAI